MDLPLKWEFPGGKIEQGEDAEACLVREIREELNMEIRVVSPLQPVEHQYPKKKIRLIPFICEKMGGEISLAEHVDFRWLPVDQLGELDWAEADIPIVKELLGRSAHPHYSDSLSSREENEN